MIYYPLSTLMLAGIRDILIISTPEDTPRFHDLLEDGSQFGITLSYAVQEAPEGLAQALLIGKEFIGDEPCAMILGDNIFYGNGFSRILQNASSRAENGTSTIFGYYVTDPERFGIVEFDDAGKVISVEEKPKHPKSNYAITGLYFYPGGRVRIWPLRVEQSASRRTGDHHAERNVSSMQGNLDVELFGRGFAWLDTGTMDSLVDAADFVRMVEKRQGVKISAPEEIAYRFGWIDKEELLHSAEKYGKSPYGAHLKIVAEGTIRSSVRSTKTQE